MLRPKVQHHAGMELRPTLHFVHGSSRSRAELARLGYSLGHHAEVYSDCIELMARPPEQGVVIALDDPELGGVNRILRALAVQGIWLPLVAMAQEPSPHRIVAAVKAGALDYLTLPLGGELLTSSLKEITEEARAHTEARRRMLEARSRIANLTIREREVLDWLAEGNSNKAIASRLEISPRTVEIHRANMMSKLGAVHSAEAVRLKIESQLQAGNAQEAG